MSGPTNDGAGRNGGTISFPSPQEAAPFDLAKATTAAIAAFVDVVDVDFSERLEIAIGELNHLAEGDPAYAHILALKLVAHFGRISKDSGDGA